MSVGVQRDHQRGAGRDLTNCVAACAPEGLLLGKMCFAVGASIHAVRGPTRVIGGRVAVEDVEVALKSTVSKAANPNTLEPTRQPRMLAPYLARLEVPLADGDEAAVTVADSRTRAR
eukprot:8516933-Pyramimonas_sp.AAC.1